MSNLKKLSVFKKAKIYKTCSELPIGVFFRILESNDLTLLCVEGKVKQDQLKLTWESIIKEYEVITGKPEYTNTLIRTIDDCKKIQRLNALTALFWMMCYEPNGDYAEHIEYWGIRGKDANSVKTQLLQERTKFNIDLIKREGKESVKARPQSFESLKAKVEYILNKDYIDETRTSVKQWVEYCKLVEEKTKAIKSVNERGRGKDNDQ